MRVKKIILVLSVLMMSGCASMGNWQPTVDPYGDRHANRIPRDQFECKRLANQASGGTVSETFMGAATGAVVGAAGGAITGAFLGNPAMGAAVGAAAGGFGGGAGMGFNAENQFKISYKNCMRHRGHAVM